ncbi:hypothetical protein Athai_44170 [Actinocatenispora thailandica]|uniref:Uncharacterized protein n=1 Tax=Actinocatenispora thailandica TaxID=227318 RepID=A0A7R7DSA4_9ACTN|nr:hypothetical protein Athai_44170 [Actinocatenispora thailandica]
MAAWAGAAMPRLITAALTMPTAAITRRLIRRAGEPVMSEPPECSSHKGVGGGEHRAVRCLSGIGYESETNFQIRLDTAQILTSCGTAQEILEKFF